MRRVVITGLGLVTPLGTGVELTWQRLLKSQSGIRAIESFDVSDLPAKIGGQIFYGDGTDGTFNPDEWMNEKDRRKVDNFILYGVAAACQAVEDSGWKPQEDADRERTGVLIGSGIGGLVGIHDASLTLAEKGARRVSPFFIPSCLINLVSGHVAIRYGFKGPNHSVVTACATGAHAIGDASRLIQFGDADVMIAGGAEASVCRLGMAGFAAARALSTNFNDRPTEASRPWDKDRDGFVMGDGSGVIVLEEYEHARRRGAKIYAEIVGYGLSGDAHHITAPAEDGDGAFRAMRRALEVAQINKEEIDYINAHGTSTPLGDAIEVIALKRLFGDAVRNVSVSSTKSAIGHLLGAAGGVEAIFTILALQDQEAPPTLNLHQPSGECDLDFVPHHPKQRSIRYAMSNSFGFGGTNASLIFKCA